MKDVVPFESSEFLHRAVTLPHAGEITGMAIESGIMSIVNGGYHGKSAPLSALQCDVYAYIPGDGHELVITTPDAMRIRATDGHVVTAVDVSAFIARLPIGANARAFFIENTSGPTSQAAAIMETVELDLPLLLIDGGTSATNLLIRDEHMRILVATEKEPITPLIDRIGAFTASGVSTVIVMGDSGDHLGMADRALMLDSHRCLDMSGCV